MPIRRHCDPINIKKIWDAVRAAHVSHQVCDNNRILKYFQKTVDCNQSQVDLYIKQAMKDGLIVYTRKSGVDVANPTYKITDQEVPDFDGKDWYCFECHLAGDVTACANCFRVFHSDCIKGAKKKFKIQKNSTSLSFNNTSISSINQSLEESEFDQASEEKSVSDDEYDENLCSVCNVINIDQSDLDKEEMNYLLKFVLHRVRAWLPDTITHTMAHEDRPAWLTDSELTWRAIQLFFEHRDMSVIEVNLNTQIYSLLSEFFADILTVQHNVAIFHGIESQEYQAAEMMVRDTLHELKELKNCSDCYKHSNEKINSKWFTLPCRIQHKLVWAKQKGYPYWPAKVIKESSSHYDVRFFGGKHERSLIHKTFVKPISISKHKMKIKQTAAFSKAYEELLYHQKLLSDPKALEKLITESKSKKKIKLSLSPEINTDPPKKRGRPVTKKIDMDVSTVKKRKSTSTEKPVEQAKKPKNEFETTSSEVISGNVIDISDGEDEDTDYSFRGNSSCQESLRFEDSLEQVTSSTENCQNTNQDVGLHQLDQPYSDSVEKMRRKLETVKNKSEIIKISMDCMQAEIDRITNDHNEHLKRLFESHNAQISETKKKQWCYHCEQDAIYHCCWNTAYCSQICQQQHWQAEHKKVCRRKRQN